ncbi:MAG: UDP-2,3-diacylglucosamine diphosphatase [Saprospiraceae bacterium]
MKKTFFCSDFHFGIPGKETSSARERLFLEWIKMNRDDMESLYIIGDLFDFWFEYNRVVPKGGIRVLACLAELNETGIPVHLFSGNHDQWMFGYFQDELGLKVYHDPIEVTIGQKKLFIGHGDGLGPGDHGYKFIKKVFRHPASRKLFSWIPPGIGIPMARYWSGESRSKGVKENKFLGPEHEWLILFCEEYVIHHQDIDYFIFGHRHLPMDWRLSNGSRYINLGDWLSFHSYAVLDEGILEYKFFKSDGNLIHSNH